MALDYKSSLGRYRRYLQMVQERPLLATSMWLMLSLILIIVLIVLALRPTLVTIAELVSSINQQKDISTRLEEKMIAVQKAGTSYENVKTRLNILDAGLPQKADWQLLTSRLQEMVLTSGLDLDNIVINKIPLSTTEPIGSKQETIVINTPKGIIPIRYTVTAIGNYEEIRKLVEMVQNMRRVSIINRVQIDALKEGGYKVIIQAETGYLPEKFAL